MGEVSAEAATLGLGAVLLATMIVTLSARALVVRNGWDDDRQLTLYQTAMLAGGPRRVSDTALSFLAWSGVIEVRESTDRLVKAVSLSKVPDIHPVEISVLNAIDVAGVKPGLAMAAGRSAAIRHISGLDGLLVSAASLLVVGSTVVVGCGAVLAGAAWWVVTSTSAGTGFVPLVALAALVYAGWWFSEGRPRLTEAGASVLSDVRLRLDSDLQVAAIGVTSLPLERAMTLIAVYGRDALTGGLSGLRKVLTGHPAPSVLVARSSLGR